VVVGSSERRSGLCEPSSTVELDAAGSESSTGSSRLVSAGPAPGRGNGGTGGATAVSCAELLSTDSAAALLSLFSDCRRLTTFLTPSHSSTPCGLVPPGTSSTSTSSPPFSIGRCSLSGLEVPTAAALLPLNIPDKLLARLTLVFLSCPA
jgi:hypothetical protein